MTDHNSKVAFQRKIEYFFNNTRNQISDYFYARNEMSDYFYLKTFVQGFSLPSVIWSHMTFGYEETRKFVNKINSHCTGKTQIIVEYFTLGQYLGLSQNVV